MDNILIPFIVFAVGVLCLLCGLWKKLRTGSFKSKPLRAIGSLRLGELQAVSGRVHSPAPVNGPVSGAPCVFYAEKTERTIANSVGHRSGVHHYWETVSDLAYGAFFLDDGSGKALIAPPPYSLDLAKPDFNWTDDIPLVTSIAPATRKTEKRIEEGENATVLGIPGTLSQFLGWVRATPDAYMPTELVADLARMEAAGGAQLPCFFSRGVERVSDLSYNDYVSASSSSASFLLQAGVAMTLFGGAGLLYSLGLF